MSEDAARAAKAARATIYQATIEADAATAARIVDALEDMIDPPAMAVGLFERGPGRFEVFAYYAEPPAREKLLRLFETNAAGDHLATLRIDGIAEADWVTLSQGKRGPVTAGRFLVHGSHDRHRAPQHRFVV